MKLTRQWLKDNYACKECVEWFDLKMETDAIEIIKYFIREKEHLDWANWLIVRIMEYKQYVAYAVFAAEQVVGIFEAKYPDDKRPRRAVEAAKACIENPSQENKDAANTAANAAYAAANTAAYAAYYTAAAVYAAYYTAAAAYAAAADAAAYAAAADAAAYAAAYAAYAARQRQTMQIKILEYGLGLLDEGER